MSSTVRHIPVTEGRSVLGGRLTLKLGAADTGEAYSFLRGHTPSGLGPPLHAHELEDETFYVLRGTYEMKCGDEHVTVGPGACLHLPRYWPHTFRNVSDEPGELVELMTPGGLDRYFDAVSHLGPEAEDLVARNEVGRPFGLSFFDDAGEYAGPPPGKVRRSFTVRGAGEGRTADFGAHQATWKVEPDEADGLHGLIEVLLDPGQSSAVPPSSQSLCVVLEGRIAVESEGVRVEAGAWDAVALLAAGASVVGNADGRPARFLHFSIPGN